MSDAKEAQRRVGPEARKSLSSLSERGLIDRYLSGPHILDIGFKGHLADSLPIVPQAIGVELDYPGYDGRTLPFANDTQDAVFSSHCLEHFDDAVAALAEWYRVVRPGGHIVIAVPHQHLYEKRVSLPSAFNDDHKRFYTPATLLADVERALPPNGYRISHLADNDRDYDYSRPPNVMPAGCYEIELVIEKRVPPSWRLYDPRAIALDLVTRGRDLAPFVIYGAGEIGCAVARIAREQGLACPAIVDRDTRLWGTSREGVPVMSLADAAAAGHGHFLVASLAYGDEIVAALRDEIGPALRFVTAVDVTCD